MKQYIKEIRSHHHSFLFFMCDDLSFINTMQKTLKPSQKNVSMPRMDERKLHTQEFQLKGSDRNMRCNFYFKKLHDPPNKIHPQQCKSPTKIKWIMGTNCRIKVSTRFLWTEYWLVQSLVLMVPLDHEGSQKWSCPIDLVTDKDGSIGSPKIKWIVGPKTWFTWQF